MCRGDQLSSVYPFCRSISIARRENGGRFSRFDSKPEGITGIIESDRIAGRLPVVLASRKPAGWIHMFLPRKNVDEREMLPKSAGVPNKEITMIGANLFRYKACPGGSCVPSGPAVTLAMLVLLLSLAFPFARPLSALSGSAAHAADQADQYEGKRAEMVASQLAGRGIENREVLEAMAEVQRHLFVPENLRRLAYGDFPLPIGHGQTISQPYIVAFMTEVIRPAPGQRVLEIGTGSGYQAAVLAELVAEVYTIEIVPELAQSADNRLRQLGYANVKTREGDGYYGWPEAGPFDAIVVTAAAEFIPPPLLQQLKEGGLMIIPVGSPFHVQHLMLVNKEKGDRVTTRKLMPVRFVPFRRAE